jgi:sulfatase modifying factor 1
MHGNAWEWVRDWYDEYVPGVEVDPAGAASGKCSEEVIRILKLDKSTACRVVRGGSFDVSPEALRSANRDGVHPEGRGEDVGFRCVRVPPALSR